MPEKKASKAASPPAEAPIPTIGNLSGAGTTEPGGGEESGALGLIRLAFREGLPALFVSAGSFSFICLPRHSIHTLQSLDGTNVRKKCSRRKYSLK
jgi:hypothetical protein